MQYFVSIENTSYFYWQVELLIESFKKHGMENQLIIGIAENNQPKIRGYSKNLVYYGNNLMHPNYGESKGYKPLNRLYVLVNAIENGVLKFPFTLIHSDMLLMKPIVNEHKEDIILHTEGNQPLEKTLEPMIQEVARKREIDRSKLPERLPFEGPVVFNNCDIRLFQRVLQLTEELLKTHGDSFPCEKAAWILTFFETIGVYDYRAEWMACTLLHNEVETNFIHYNHGIPPVFNKRFFRHEKDINLSTEPYKILLEHNPTTTTNYLQSIINSYQNNH